MNRYQPMSVTIAAALLALVSVLGIALPLIGGGWRDPPSDPYIRRGAGLARPCRRLRTVDAPKVGLLAGDRCVRSTRSARIQVSLPRPQRY